LLMFPSQMHPFFEFDYFYWMFKKIFFFLN
jgi:hypothetical protein